MRQHHDRESTTMTRRSWLGLALAGASSSLLAPRLTAAELLEDNAPPLKGRIFTENITSRANQAVGPVGPGVLDLESGTWSTLSYEGRARFAKRVSPNGRFVAFYRGERPGTDEAKEGIRIFDVEGEADLKFLTNGTAVPFGWTRDGAIIMFHRVQRNNGFLRFETWKINADGTLPIRLPLPDTDIPLDLSSDGKWVLVKAEYDRAQAGNFTRTVSPLDVVSVDAKERTRIMSGHLMDPGNLVPLFDRARFTPDGRHVIYGQNDQATRLTSLWSVGVDGKNRRCVIPAAEGERLDSFCVSPDGNSVAFSLVKRTPPQDGQERNYAYNLIVVDIDGRNPRTLPELPTPEFSLIDWRPH
jgi:Tol biopolymer transport system component